MKALSLLLRHRKKLLAVVVLALALGALWRNFGAVVLWALRPGGAFAPAQVPPPPRYEERSAWSALPEASSAELAADVFYVHPTSFLGSQWNARLDDATVNQATDRGGTGIQATAFARCCRVYAPRYRQANLNAFVRPSPDATQAIALAASDVAAALRYYLAHYNHGRALVLAGHSQGSVVLLPALRELAADPALRERLVVAYLLGSSLTERTLASTGLSACDSATQQGCVVGWNARSPSYRGGLDFVEAHGVAPSPRVCVNPLTWRHDEQPAAASLHRGALFYDPSLRPLPARERFTSARCHGGFLLVEPAGAIPRDFMSGLLDHALGDGNYHPVEYGLFFVDLGDNAQARVAAWRAAHAGP